MAMSIGNGHIDWQWPCRSVMAMYVGNGHVGWNLGMGYTEVRIVTDWLYFSVLA